MASLLTKTFQNYRSVKCMGKPDQKVWFLGRSPDVQDLESNFCFQSGAGRMLVGAAKDAGISFSKTYRRYFLNHLPPFGNFGVFCCKKTDLKEFNLSQRELDILRIGKASYLHPNLLPELNDLLLEIRQNKPNIIIGLGAEVSYWLTGDSVEASRGFITDCRLVKGQKVICSYDPSAILANWANRPIMVADLLKAERESHFPEIVVKPRTVYIPETVDDVEWFFDKLQSTDKISVDIETFPNQRLIRSVGISFNEKEGMCIPFTEFSTPDGSYWGEQDELKVWNLIRVLMKTKNEKIGQNFSYDADWLYREVGVPVYNYTRDTLIKHHSMYSEVKKSLSFMASLYLDEPKWKNMMSHNPEKG